ncbi:MAG: acyl carrier protein [Methylococcales bacterium]|jgi:acyl carrier protein|nr:acyl carrier protein [Methylococcales bacterium]MBT5231062.1 acyl carrier protein [Methylococcales bacterium]
MNFSQDVANIICDALQLSITLNEDTLLLGNIPELDSMAIVSVIERLEAFFEITFDDDDISADHFESVATLVTLIKEKMHSH